MATASRSAPGSKAGIRAAPELGEAKRFLFVGGGTGGHLAPALGLAEELQRRGHRVAFLTSGRGVEADFLEDIPEQHALGVDTARLPRPLALLPALWRARGHAARFRPDCVIGLGGLTGAAALVCRQGAPLILLEGNFVVGRGVRLLKHWARATLTLYEPTARELARGRCVGPIGRRRLEPVPRAEARRRIGLSREATVLLLTGGSQGAQDLNRFVARSAGELAEAGVALLAATGRGKAEELRAACTLNELEAVIFEQSSDMGLLYSAADFALCRGGAATMAELWLHRLPAAVVPYPHHSDRHQLHNARALEPGVFVLELDGADAPDRLLEVLRSASRRAEMAAALAGSAPEDGRVRAADFLLEQAG